jgi:hypothetical protein
MTTENWNEVVEYLGGNVEQGDIYEAVSLLQERVNVVLHGYRTHRHIRWKDLQTHVKQVGYYNSVHGVDYINKLTDEFVAEYGTYDGSIPSYNEDADHH